MNFSTITPSPNPSPPTLSARTRFLLTLTFFKSATEFNESLFIPYQLDLCVGRGIIFWNCIGKNKQIKIKISEKYKVNVLFITMPLIKQKPGNIYSLTAHYKITRLKILRVHYENIGAYIIEILLVKTIAC